MKKFLISSVAVSVFVLFMFIFANNASAQQIYNNVTSGNNTGSYNPYGGYGSMMGVGYGSGYGGSNFGGYGGGYGNQVTYNPIPNPYDCGYYNPCGGNYGGGFSNFGGSRGGCNGMCSNMGNQYSQYNPYNSYAQYNPYGSSFGQGYGGYGNNSFLGFGAGLNGGFRF